MQVQIDSDLAVKIQTMADTNGLSVTRYVNGLLEAALDREFLAVFAVEVELPYSDHNPEQPTSCYRWRVIRDNRADAEFTGKVIREELGRTLHFSSVTPHIYIPVDYRDEELVISYLEALSRLRRTLICHKSDSLKDDPLYFIKTGFTEEEWDEVEGYFETGLWDFANVDEDSDLFQELNEFIEQYGITPTLQKLGRWSHGE